LIHKERQLTYGRPVTILKRQFNVKITNSYRSSTGVTPSKVMLWLFNRKSVLTNSGSTSVKSKEQAADRVPNPNINVGDNVRKKDKDK